MQWVNLPWQDLAEDVSGESPPKLIPAMAPFSPEQKAEIFKAFLHF